MPRPEASAAAEELYSALEPAFTTGDEDRDWIALKICMAIVAGRIDLLHGYLIDDVLNLPAWAVIFDPERAPAEALPYLAQFSGAILTPEMTEAARRNAIQTPEAFSRGRKASLEAVVKRRLEGTKAVVVTERYASSAWKVRIETLEAETPDPDGVVADLVRFQKPVGVLLFFNTRVAWDWGQLQEEAELYPDWSAVKGAFATWFDLRTHAP